MYHKNLLVIHALYTDACIVDTYPCVLLYRALNQIIKSKISLLDCCARTDLHACQAKYDADYAIGCTHAANDNCSECGIIGPAS